MYSLQSLCLIVNLILFVNNINAGIFPNKCKLNDSDCMVKVANEFLPTFADGIPSLGIDSIDPMYIEEVDASSGILKFFMKNNTVTGLRNAKINSVKVDPAKSTLSFVYTVTCRVESLYNISGNLLLLTIEGKGPLHCYLRGLEVHVTLSLKEVLGADGKMHWKLSYKNHKYYTRDKCDVEFENLFNGNEFLAAATKEVIAQNGNAIVNEIGGPAVSAVIFKYVKNIIKMFEQIPVEETYIN